MSHVPATEQRARDYREAWHMEKKTDGYLS